MACSLAVAAAHVHRDLSSLYDALSTRFCNAVGIGAQHAPIPETCLIRGCLYATSSIADDYLRGMAHPQHDSQRAVPQPFLFSEWNIPSISLKDNSQQPSFFPPVVVHRLRQELAGAQKKLEEYEDISTYLGILCQRNY